MKTIGISPKVLTPALALVVIGAVLVIAGNTTTGESLIAAGLGGGALGYVAPPGAVDVPLEDGNPVLPE